MLCYPLITQTTNRDGRRGGRKNQENGVVISAPDSGAFSGVGSFHEENIISQMLKTATGAIIGDTVIGIFPELLHRLFGTGIFSASFHFPTALSDNSIDGFSRFSFRVILQMFLGSGCACTPRPFPWMDGLQG